MIWLLKVLWFGHVHKWAKVKEEEIVRHADDTSVGTRYVVRCEACGAMRAFNCW